MSKHTPGPWRRNKYRGIGGGPLGLTPFVVLAEGLQDATDADISLIAAAPDLLEMLKIVEPIVILCASNVLAAKVRDLIEKAEGLAAPTDPE